MSIRIAYPHGFEFNGVVQKEFPANAEEDQGLFEDADVLRVVVVSIYSDRRKVPNILEFKQYLYSAIVWRVVAPANPVVTFDFCLRIDCSNVRVTWKSK